MTPESALTRTITPALPPARAYGTVVLLLADIIALIVAVAAAVGIKAIYIGHVDLYAYVQLWPFIFVFLAVFASIGLYSGLGIGAPEELRRTTIASTILFLFLAGSTMSLRGGTRHFTWTLAIAMLLAVALVPLLRECARQLYARRPWWGFPAVVFGAGKTGETVVRALLNEPGLGLRPVAVLDDNPERCKRFKDVGLVGPTHLVHSLVERQRPAYAVFAMPDIPPVRLASMIEEYGANFSHVLVIPELSGFASLWVDSKSVGGMVGLELRQQVLLSDYSIAKRAVDLGLIALGSTVALPVCALIALAIRLESRGPVFYSQQRIGRNGRRFRAWKFRSMVADADRVLEKYLDANPGLRAEWDRDHKLKNDPRVTRVGRVIRRASLDELPQLWNILRGDMSLVGPRPIVDKEVAKYGSAFEVYKRVKGGLTGLWQVSGRNDVSYEERIYLDQFYVRNWSIWLDFCILFRTIAVVLFSKGAY